MEHLGMVTYMVICMKRWTRRERKSEPDWWMGRPAVGRTMKNRYISWLFNIAMENGPFIDDFPMKTSIYSGFSMAMLNNQMVYQLSCQFRCAAQSANRCWLWKTSGQHATLIWLQNATDSMVIYHSNGLRIHCNKPMRSIGQFFIIQTSPISR